MRRLSRVHANHRRIVTSALIIGVLTVIAKLFVAGREVSIAWRYGVSGTVDAYQLAVTIVIWMPMMLISVMTAVFVPRLVKLQTTNLERRQFISELNGALLLIGIAIAALTWAAAPSTSRLLASNDQPETVALTAQMCRLMSPVACFVVWIGYLSARLQARERFAYTITEAAPALTIAASILAPLLMPPEIRLGVATLIGYVVQVIVLALMISRRDQPIGGIRFRHKSSEWSSVYRDLGIVAAAQVIFMVAVPIDQALAARLGTGSVAAFAYATRLVTLVTGLGAVVFTRAFLPVFSTSIVRGSSKIAARQARQWALILTMLGLAVVVAGWFSAPWTVAVVFKRGAFTAADVRTVAQVYRFGILQVPFVFGGLALGQLIAAKGQYSVLLWSACAAVVLKVLLNFILIGRFHLAGLMTATAVMYAFSFGWQYLVIRDND